MTITSQLTADLRARSTFLPYCPLCSYVSVRDIPDILRGPSHRTFRGISKLNSCCLLSAGCPQMDSPAEVAAWWRKRRLEPHKDLATDSRRRNCLAKLAAKELEPIE